MSETAVKICPSKCVHEAQDKLHGKGKRVFNFREKKGGYSCTVCGAELGTAASAGKKAKKKK